MKHLIYLDAHFIDYLWDHQKYIWEGDENSLNQAATTDQSTQLEEYEALEGLPEICWVNHWHLIVGECVLDELERISDKSRRKALKGYAEQIMALSGLGLCSDDDYMPTYFNSPNNVEQIHPLQLLLPVFKVMKLPSPGTFSQVLKQARTLLPTKDMPLVEEALSLGCDIFLTTDSRLLKRGKTLESLLGLRIRRLTEFLSEEKGPSQTHVVVWPDLLLYTGLIPNNPF